MEVIGALRFLPGEGVTSEDVLSTDTYSAPRDVGLDLIDTGHWFDGEVSVKANSQPEGLVRSDAVSAHVRA